MSIRRLVTTGTGALLTIAIAIGANSAQAGLPYQAHGDVSITYNRYAFTVCAAGLVDAGARGGHWLLDISGTRSDGTAIHERVAGFGTRFRPSCQGIPRYESAYGVIVVTLSFGNPELDGQPGEPPPGVVAGGEGSWGLNTATSFGS